MKDADFYILNSCSVTHKSDNEAMYLLRAAKHKNPNVVTIATGCMAQIEKEELLKNDFIDYVVGNDEKLHLYEIINSDTKFLAKDILKLAEFSKVELIDTTKTRASLKIQDGCDNRCTYCIIWKARGKVVVLIQILLLIRLIIFQNMGLKRLCSLEFIPDSGVKSLD